MAQIEQSDKGGKKKGAQKKMQIHVDFTPMVDMNMLLITFFMLCTTMIKSQSVSLILPAPPDPNKPLTTEADKTRVMTLILDTQYDENNMPLKDENGNTIHDVYYYFGDPKDDKHDPDDLNRPKELYHETYVANGNSGELNGIRKVIARKNKEVLKKYNELKEEYDKGNMADSTFNRLAAEIDKKDELDPAVIIIKALPNATYENVINAFDEFKANRIANYSFQQVSSADSILIQDYETKHPDTKILRASVRENRK